MKYYICSFYVCMHPMMRNHIFLSNAQQWGLQIAAGRKAIYKELIRAHMGIRWEGPVPKWWYFLAWESVMLGREREVNPWSCFPPKADGAVQHLMDPNSQQVAYRQAQGRGHKNKPVLHRVPGQAGEQACPWSRTHLLDLRHGMGNHSWVSTARLSNPVPFRSSGRISDANNSMERVVLRDRLPLEDGFLRTVWPS